METSKPRSHNKTKANIALVINKTGNIFHTNSGRLKQASKPRKGTSPNKGPAKK
jgi:hypothetical protein